MKRSIIIISFFFLTMIGWDIKRYDFVSLSVCNQARTLVLNHLKAPAAVTACIQDR